MKNKHILERLATMSDEERIHDFFDFGYINGSDSDLSLFRWSTRSDIPYCGTLGCLAGELPGLDSDWYFADYGAYTLMHRIIDDKGFTGMLREYFDLPAEAIEHLFWPTHQAPDKFGGKHLNHNSTFEEAQNNIIEFLKTYKDE